MAAAISKLKPTFGRYYRRTEAAVGRAIFERGDFIDTSPVEYFDGDLSEDYKHYAPSSWPMLPRALRKVDITPDDVFLEMGSGMGRVVYQAAKGWPFRRVIGVDLEERWNEIARHNIEANTDRLRCKDVEIITADATTWAVPDDVTIVYLYNPFEGPIFEAFMDRLLESMDRRPRHLTLIYAKPLSAELVDRTGRFERVHYLRGLRPRHIHRHIAIWRAK